MLFTSNSVSLAKRQASMIKKYHNYTLQFGNSPELKKNLTLTISSLGKFPSFLSRLVSFTFTDCLSLM